jgi:hypothetical protein
MQTERSSGVADKTRNAKGHIRGVSAKPQNDNYTADYNSGDKNTPFFYHQAFLLFSKITIRGSSPQDFQQGGAIQRFRATLTNANNSNDNGVWVKNSLHHRLKGLLDEERSSGSDEFVEHGVGFSDFGARQCAGSTGEKHCPPRNRAA